MMNLLASLTAWLFPPCCVNCGSTAGWLCFLCEREWRAQILTQVTIYKLDQLQAYVAIQDPSSTLSKLLFAWKYQRYLGASVLLQSLWSDAFTKVVATTQRVVLVPVPIHWFKRWQRGFNQAEEMSRLVTRAWPVESKLLLKRIRYTSTQVGLSKAARQNNLKRAFAVNDAILHEIACDDLIVLVDDIVTSGTTLIECADVLRQAGFHHILALVLHRGTRSAL